MLAGAALEIALRSAIEELDLIFEGQPSISVYARTLRKAEVLNKQDMKEVEQMAGLRNDAAHGNHDLLSRERSGLMEQQVNLFLNRARAVRPTVELRSTVDTVVRSCPVLCQAEVRRDKARALRTRKYKSSA